MRIHTLVTLFFGSILLTLKFILCPAEAALAKPIKPGSVPSYIIVLDPGHGGEDAGSVAKTERKSRGKPIDVYEKTLVLQVAKRVSRYLRDPKLMKTAGRPVKDVMTREKEKSPSLDS